MSEKPLTYRCEYCGKDEYSSEMAKKRHQRRSKICRGIQSKVNTLPDIITSMANLGFTVINVEAKSGDITKAKKPRSLKRVNKSV